MGLFDKKTCDICGGDIGLLGNKKLADGNMCKNCAKKLSPWMTDRRESTVEEIRRHLLYRAQNVRELAALRPTVAIGANTKVYIDENARKFFVTHLTDWRDANPDIVDFSQVIDVQTEVTEHRTEEYHRDREGRQVSFNPPRYRFSYEFETTILVDSPYFSRIHFELTGTRPERLGSDEYRYYEQQADALRALLMSAPKAEPAPKSVPKAATLAETLSQALNQVTATAASAAVASQSRRGADQWACACGTLNAGNFCTNCGAKRPEKPKVFRCDKCGWTPEDPKNPPRFCPNCGDPFNASDAV